MARGGAGNGRTLPAETADAAGAWVALDGVLTGPRPIGRGARVCVNYPRHALLHGRLGTVVGCWNGRDDARGINLGRCLRVRFPLDGRRRRTFEATLPQACLIPLQGPAPAPQPRPAAAARKKAS